MTAFLFNVGCLNSPSRGRNVNNESYEFNPPEGSYTFFQTGTASWYGKKFNGRPTASGEIFNMYGLSAAHKTIPLGTHILVVNKLNGKRIKVKVNDRGPFIKGRVLDLSFAAAKELGYSELGLAEVDIYVYGKIDENCISIQIGAFESKDRALAFLEKFKKKFSDKIYIVNEDDLFKVLFGKFDSRIKAENFRDKNLDLSSGFIVSCK